MDGVLGGAVQTQSIKLRISQRYDERFIGVLGQSNSIHSSSRVPLSCCESNFSELSEYTWTIDPIKIIWKLQLAETVNLHFLTLLEALLECGSILYHKLLPLWYPILHAHHTQVNGSCCIFWIIFFMYKYCTLFSAPRAYANTFAELL